MTEQSSGYSRGGTTTASFHYLWEESTCLLEPLRDEEVALLSILKSLGEPFVPSSPPPLWHHAQYPIPTPTPTNKEDSENITTNPPPTPTPILSHYCLVNGNQFVFCGGDPDSCLCSKEDNMANSSALLPTTKEIKAITHLGQHLKSNCDKILDRSVPFVLDQNLLSRLSLAVNQIFDEKFTSKEWDEYRDLVLFISDFCQQTPTLCINGSASKVGGGGGGGGSSGQIDLSLFKSLLSLEVRSAPLPSTLPSLRLKLQRIKSSRNLNSIKDLLQRGKEASSSSVAGQIWPELREIDVSYNSISSLEPELLEFCPSLEILNLSTNRLSGTLSTSTLLSLTTLNLSFNQITALPGIPPNLRILILSHNLIGTLECVHSLKNLQVLDLSTNMLAKQEVLLPLREMSCLKKLNLSENPLTFMPDYRRTVISYMNRIVISRRFELDKKCLSSAEVKVGIEDCKQDKFIPYVPSTSIHLATTAATTLSRSFTSPSIMNQSFESNSSRGRSLQRKKPKIREIKTLDEDYDQERGAGSSGSGSGSGGGGGGSSMRSGSGESSVELHGSGRSGEMRQALTSLREKYGPEHWLLRQKTEIDKLLHIPQQPISYELYSRSLPSHPPNSYGSPPSSSVYYERSLNNQENYTNEELILINSRIRKQKEQVYNRNKSSRSSSGTTTAAKEEEEVDAASNSNSSATATVCSSSSPPPEEQNSIFPSQSSTSDAFPSIFDNSSTAEDSYFILSQQPKEVYSKYGIFQNGELLYLVITDGYLLELQPHDDLILSKWDLNCLEALEEERHDEETDSVQFRLRFDTMRKSMREKSFIMGAKEFSKFDQQVSPYIEERTMEQVFTEALQCTKCFAQFSKTSAPITVKTLPGVGPREVRICPHCENDGLVTLDNVPLPNDECLDFDEIRRGGGPLKASTPTSVSLSQSIPKKSPIFDFMRLLPSSLKSKGILGDYMPIPPPTTTTTSTTKSYPASKSTNSNTKSESDIEVLSSDSSSIEVLGKHCPDSGSEVDVEEAVEIPVIDTTPASKSFVPMSESTSSSSCADSIVTTYEKHLLLPISQPLNSPRSSVASSTSTFSSSFSPIHTPPVLYDYVNFSRTDHRLQLWADISVFKSDEELLALTKCLIISDSGATGNFLGLVIFSTKKVYLYRIIGTEGDRPQDWLQKVNYFDLGKFLKLDVLIGRHGIGVDFSGKYFALMFRDSERTSGFLEFFMSDICGQLKNPPMVRDFSQTQKMMLSPQNPISYFGIMRFAICDNADTSYSVSAVLLTNEEILLITDLGWMAGRCDKVSTTHGRKLKELKQVELMEVDGSFIRLFFETDKRILSWELVFETDGESRKFEESLRSDCSPDVPFICLSLPLES